MWTGERFVGAGLLHGRYGVGGSVAGAAWEWGSTLGEWGWSLTGFSALGSDGRQLLAFGFPGELLSSPDGVGWTEKASPLGWWVNGAVYADDRWVAVGHLGQTAVSADGDAWGYGVPALFDSFSGRPAARSGSVTVAVACDETAWHPVVYRSVNGAAWERHALVGLPRITEVEAYGGGFLGVTTDGVASSPDGVAWTPHPLTAPSPTLEGLACSPARCVAVGTEIVASDDGETWTRSPLPAGALAAHDVVWTGHSFVAIGHMPGNTAMFLSSPDGAAWTLRTQEGIEPPATLAAHGGRLVALRGGQGRILTALAGQPWTTIVLPRYDDLLEVVWTGTFLAALGARPDGQHLALWLSADGQSWSEAAPPAAQGRLGLAGFGTSLNLFGSSGEVFSGTCSGFAAGRAPTRRLFSQR